MLIVLLPAYNEAGSIEPLLRSLADTFRGLERPARVLLVDDGSTDGTPERARAEADRLGVDLEIERHGTNRGLGAALRTGFRRANEMLGGEGVLIGMDADNTHDPGVIPSMLRKMEEGNDVVIASRYAPGGREVGLSSFRSILSRGASFTMRLFLPVKGARDYSCGYRAYSGRALERAIGAYGDQFIAESGFVASAEILVKMARLPSKVAEVPLVLRYDRKGGASKMNIWKTITRYLTLIRAGRRVANEGGGAA
ncbi:MAG: glycosyltransferase [Candidatus Eisenbacteria bacterium]|nr:glycosyltransferase [Candidatus Eisenbacteria bacterium]